MWNGIEYDRFVSFLLALSAELFFEKLFAAVDSSVESCVDIESRKFENQKVVKN